MCCWQHVHCTCIDIYIFINPARFYQVLMISAISPRQKWQKLWQKYFLPCFSPSCGRNTFLPGRKPTLALFRSRQDASQRESACRTISSCAVYLDVDAFLGQVSNINQTRRFVFPLSIVRFVSDCDPAKCKGHYFFFRSFAEQGFMFLIKRNVTVLTDTRPFNVVMNIS